jgi:hypothetical protein
MQPIAHNLLIRIAAPWCLFDAVVARKNPMTTGSSYVSLFCRQSGPMT